MAAPMSVTPKNPAPTFVANCKRLLNDAHILLEHGSPGSAMSLAILAFEEAGKGHDHELSLNKTKKIPSWHQYRHVVAAFVLTASWCQKYGLQPPELTPRMQELLSEGFADTKTLSKWAAKPMPEELRQLMREALTPSLDALDGDLKIIATAELLWVKKIINAAARGQIETLRQSGMYVDLGKDEEISDPSSVTGRDAYYWIRVAERTLLILEHGDFASPYGELATEMEAMSKPLT